MKLVIQSYKCLCELKIFTINGIEADYNDFGMKFDNDISKDNEYSCGNMIFIPKANTASILGKYNINEYEYIKITQKLEKKVIFWQLLVV